MNQGMEILKAAFIARVNQPARAIVVDTYYKKVSGGCVLMLVYANGTEKVFQGLRAA
jgi:hypothetical protein